MLRAPEQAIARGRRPVGRPELERAGIAGRSGAPSVPITGSFCADRA
jgi:hypothetical protein